MLVKCAIVAALALMLATSSWAGKYVVAYVVNWNDLPAYVPTIDYAKLTHINIAFENPIDDEGNLSYQPNNDLLIAQARAKGVKVLMSIGGGLAASDPVMQKRYFALIKPEARGAFAVRLAKYLDDHKLDGLDVDIEGPSINEDYGGFISELARVLRPKGKLLTSALSRGYGGDKVPSATLAEFDFVNIMAYDATGPWQPNNPGPHSSFDYAKENVDYWLARGLPKSKAVLGLPFYGHAFGAAASAGEHSFRDIVAKYPGAEKVDEIGDRVYYNGIPTIQAKCRYVVDAGLAGVMIWHLEADAPAPNSLLNVISESLRR